MPDAFYAKGLTEAKVDADVVEILVSLCSEGSRTISCLLPWTRQRITLYHIQSVKSPAKRSLPSLGETDLLLAKDIRDNN